MTQSNFSGSDSAVGVFIVGGIGDISFQLSLMLEKRIIPTLPLICSESQANKVYSISRELSSLHLSLQDLSEIRIITVSDKLYQSAFQELESSANKSSLTGPFVSYNHILKQAVVCGWVGCSSSVHDLLTNSLSWPITYSTYNYLRSDFLTELPHAKAPKEIKKSMLVMLDANSVFVDASVLTNFLQRSIRASTLQGIEDFIYICNDSYGNGRPDLTENKASVSLSQASIDVFEGIVSSIKHNNYNFSVLSNPSFDTLLCSLKSSSILLSLRSGICDLAWLLGKEILSIYPSRNDFSVYKLSQHDKIVFEVDESDHSPILVHTQSFC